MRRPPAAGTAPPPSNLPTRCSIQAPQLRRRCSKATLERSARPADAAHALVDLNPMPPSNVGKVREACGRSPRACRSQPHAAKAISQDQPQKIGRGLHSARPQKGTRFAGGGFDSCGPAELPQRCLPEFVQERFVSHAMLESDSIRAGKPYVSAYDPP